MKKIIVIGAGYGGLATAALLGKKGFEVTVLEKNEQVGGRASVMREKGYVFDMGPSWYLMPDVFERYFALFGKKPEDFYELERLDPSYRIFFGANEYVDIAADLGKNFALFESLEKDGEARLKRYLAQSQKQYDASMKGFVYRSYDDIFDPTFLQSLPSAMFMNFFESIGKYAKHFFNEEKARKILQYNIVFLGGSTSNTPALYAIMAHIDFNLGVWYPKGGFGAITEALVRLCKEYNVKIITESSVQKIEVENGLATGVMLQNGEKITADTIISNADYAFTEMKLLPQGYNTYPQGYWEKKTIAPSAFIIYLGVNTKVTGLTHHNLFLDNDWESHFEEIFHNPKWPEAPSYYVSCPSKTDPTVAPAGKENLFVLVPIAPGIEDTEEIRESYFTKIMTHLENMINFPIRDHIEYKKIFAIKDFANRYNAYKGTALGLSHTLFQSAWFRPRHRSRKVKNLYYVGGYTHPGIGVPMQLITAEIMSKMIK